jgi:hypothetical protein
MANGLQLTIELVPSPCWEINLRSSMTRANWDHLRKLVYAKYNYRCGVCLASNVRLNCHEIWHFDDENHIQRLTGFIALCEMCHHCKHIGLAGVLASEGKLDFEQVIAHFMRVNQCSREDYRAHEEAAFAQWRERNGFEWTTDLGMYAHLVTQKTEQIQRAKTSEHDNSARASD